MKIETHEVNTVDVIQLPEPKLQDVSGFVITAIDLATRAPAVFFNGKVKGAHRPFESMDEARSSAADVAKKTMGAAKASRYAFVRIQKMEVV